MGNQQCMSLNSVVNGIQDNFQSNSLQPVQIMQNNPVEVQLIEETSPDEESTNQATESLRPSLNIRREQKLRVQNNNNQEIIINKENEVEEVNVKEEKVKEEKIKDEKLPEGQEEENLKLLQNYLQIEREQKNEEETRKKIQLALKKEERIKKEALRKQKEEAQKKQQEFKIKKAKAQLCTISDVIPLLNQSYYKGKCYELDNKKYPHGEGVYISSPSSKLNIRGEFYNGYLIKVFHSTLKDNSTYKGDLWVNDLIKKLKFKVSECENLDDYILPHGQGKQTDQYQQWSLQGQYKMGLKHGNFIYQSNDTTLEGEFENDNPIGLFKITEKGIESYGPFQVQE